MRRRLPPRLGPALQLLLTKLNSSQVVLGLWKGRRG